jgi:hypothetical protein
MVPSVHTHGSYSCCQALRPKLAKMTLDNHQLGRPSFPRPQTGRPAMTGRDPSAPSDRRKNPARKKADRREPFREETGGGRKEPGSGDSGTDSFGHRDEE